MYEGEDFDCAAMETVYHDVPIAPGLKTLDQRKFAGLVHSVFEGGACVGSHGTLARPGDRCYDL